jgi:hypothetical protein
VSVACRDEKHCDSHDSQLGCQSASCHVLRQSYDIYWLQFGLWASGFCTSLLTLQRNPLDPKH